MIPLTLNEIARVTGGEVLFGAPGVIFRSVSTDTRTIKKGNLFFALCGERYDAHRFLVQATAAEAGGLVVSNRLGLPYGMPAILVDDTLAALHALAAFNRKRSGAIVVGVTGSTGKTTTKDMLAAVLGTRLRTLKTAGNFNNEIGLPLTLLELDERHDAAVVEMAMRRPGEIDALCRLAGPTGAVITNIGETHLEPLGNVSNIASAKGEILDHISPGGFALLHAESPFIKREATRCRGKVVFFGTDRHAGVRAENIRLENSGSRFDAVMGKERYSFLLPVPGRHNVINALAAIGAGREMGLTVEEIARGLSKVSLTGMRLEVIEAAGMKIINDAYNASPVSTKAALQVLKDLAGARRTVAVLGNMLELGPRSEEGHREVGETAAGLGLDCLVTVGDLAVSIYEGALEAGLQGGRAFQCADNAEAVKALKGFLQEGDVVLVKGSRGMKMEQIVRSLLKK